MVTVGTWLGVEVDAALLDELENSVMNATHRLSQPFSLPSLRTSSPLEWEQSLREGHPLHPMHSSRYALDPMPPLSLDTDLRNVTVKFVAMPSTDILVRGTYHVWIARLYPHPLEPGLVALPVHAMQLPNVLKHFPSARVLDHSLTAQAQASIRTVVLDAFPNMSLKLPLGIKTTSALRTITHWTAYQGPGLVDITRRVVTDERLTVYEEIASAVVRHEDSDVAKHLSCIFRHEPPVAEDERVLLCAALIEDYQGQSVATEVFGLHSIDQRKQFLHDYCDLLFRCFLPPIYQHGFAFEAHMQNVLLRVQLSGESFVLKGFAIRDFGGLKALDSKLRDTLGMGLDVLPDSYSCAKTEHEILDLAYHTLIQVHVNPLVRALGLHADGSGWSIVRDTFKRHCPPNTSLYAYFMGPSVQFKCFVKMKFQGLYRDYLYESIPNVMLLDGTNHVAVAKAFQDAA
jgi:siderophore synthetase component